MTGLQIPILARRILSKDPRRSVRIAEGAFRAIMHTIGRRRPETGGILLGPINQDSVTKFHFDIGAICTGSTYSPDHVSLGRRMKTEWLPRGLDMKGFVHSHPGDLDQPSPGDLEYIERLLKANPDMSHFIVPIVLPQEFRVRVFVVCREFPRSPIPALVTLFTQSTTEKKRSKQS